MVRDRIILVAGAILACVLQLAVAPHIAIAQAVPNFIVAYMLAVAVARPNGTGSVMPFVLGLFYDVATGGAIGPMAFSLTLFAVVAAHLCATLSNDTLFIPLVTLVIAVLLVEVSYSVFMMFLGYGAGAVDMFVYRTLPCFVYDLVIAVLLYFVMNRFVAENASSQPDVARLI